MHEQVKALQQRHVGAFQPVAQVERDLKAPYIAEELHGQSVGNFQNAQCMLCLLA
jgi:hypothetical protein